MRVEVPELLRATNVRGYKSALKSGCSHADDCSVNTCWRRAVAALTIMVAPTTIGPVAEAATPQRAGATTIVFDGHGNGHGIGLSQWGAYGYAVDHGWNAAQILDHYYGGTVASTLAPSATPPVVAVRLMRLDDQQTAVVNDNRLLVVDGVPGGPWGSVVAREVAPSRYTVWARAEVACPAASDALTQGWTPVATDLASVTVRPQTDTSASSAIADLASVCEPSGTVRSYRGAIRAVNGTTGENRTVNLVPLEQYLRPIVASEMSPSWAAKGAQALQAQVIAARTYGLAEKRYSYAATCDLICQSYPGAATRQGVGGTVKRNEYASTDAAVAATAGMVRRVGSQSGPLAYTMFSSSSGGWTAASTLGFPAVPDEGDDIASNPFHDWSATVTHDAISAAWPSIGQFTGLTVTKRSGEGDWGGRVLTIVVTGTSGSVTLSGDTFRRAVGMRSNWFTVRGDATPTPTPTPPPTPAPAPGCGAQVPPPVTGAAPSSAGSRFTAFAPLRLVDTRNGTALGAGCTLVVRPPVVAGSTAVSIGLVTVDTAAAGYLTAYPCGVSRPTTSVVQSRPGRVVSGAAIVPLGADGSLCVFSNVGTHVVVDLFGSFAPGSGNRFEPISAQRRFDSRPSGAVLPAGSVVRVASRGAGAAPADSTAASFTVHALDAAAGGYVTVWPCGTTMPVVSSVNVAAGTSVTNAVDVAVGSGGDVCFFVSAPMHLAVDLAGWYGPSATTEFHALTPFRLADTRQGTGWQGSFARNTERRIDVAGAGGIPAAAARAVVAQFTAVNAPAGGFLTVHPCLARAPQLSMLRYPASANMAALVNSVLSADGDWCVVTNASTDLVVDVTGWFG
jgi:SpoIID/LytB domain protein